MPSTQETENVENQSQEQSSFETTVSPTSTQNTFRTIPTQMPKDSQGSAPMSLQTDDDDQHGDVFDEEEEGIDSEVEGAILKTIDPVVLSNEGMEPDVTILSQVINGKSNLETWNQLLLEGDASMAPVDDELQHTFFINGMNTFVEGAKKMAEGMNMMKQASQASSIPDMTAVMVPVFQKMMTAMGVKRQGRPPAQEAEKMSFDKCKGPKPEGPRTEEESARDNLIKARKNYDKLSSNTQEAPRKKMKLEPTPSTSAASQPAGVSAETVKKPPKPKKCWKDGQIQSQCPICGEVRKSYGACSAHINKAHLNVLIKCLYCDKTSYSQDSIMAHQKKCAARPAINKVEEFEGEVSEDEEVQPDQPENAMQAIEEAHKENSRFQEQLNLLADVAVHDDIDANTMEVIFKFDE